MLNDDLLGDLQAEVEGLKPTERDLHQLAAVADGWASFVEDSLAGRPIDYRREAALKAAVAQLSSAVRTRVESKVEAIVEKRIKAVASGIGIALGVAIL